MKPNVVLIPAEGRRTRSSAYRRFAVTCVLGATLSLACAQKLHLIPQTGHTGNVCSVAFSPNGHVLASASGDKSIILWEVLSGRQVRVLSGHAMAVYSVTFSHDGHLLASGSDDSTVKVWNPLTGENLQTLRGHLGCVCSVAFSPDDRTLATGSVDGTIKLWNLTTAAPMMTMFNGSAVNSISFAKDGHTLASGGWKSLKVWDTDTGKERRSIVGQKDNVQCISLSGDGRMLANTSSDNLISIRDPATGKHIRDLLGEKTPFVTVAFSPDSRIIAGGAIDDSIKLWDAETGKELATLPGHTSTVSALAFAKDGLTLASGSWDKTVKLWNLATRTQTITLAGRSSAVCAVALSSDGNTLATGGLDFKVHLWDLQSGKEFHVLAGNLSYNCALAFSPNGRILACSGNDEMIRLWEVETGDLIRALKNPGSIAGRPGNFQSIAFSPDGRTLAGGSENKTVWLWDVESGRELSGISGNGGRVLSVAFSPDGRNLASTGSDGSIRVWELSSGAEKMVLMGQRNSVNSMCFSPDSRYLATGTYDNFIKLWDLSTGTESRTIVGHKGRVSSVAFSSDGKILLSGSEDNTIKLWTPTDGRELLTLSGHSSTVTSVALSKDGRTVVSGSMDSTVRLWDVASTKELASLVSFDDQSWAVTAPDGRFDVSDIEDSIWLQWVVDDAPFTGLPIETFSRNYFEPGLLKKSWLRENLSHLKPIGELNRARPKVSLSASVEGKTALLKIDATRGEAEITQDGKTVVQSGQPQDLRLFVNGKLVSYQDGPLALDAEGKMSKTYAVPVPLNGETEIQVSAYCFNQDFVKSETASQTLKVFEATTRGRAYLITVGVNHYDRPDLQLSYSGADAQAVSETLSKRLNGFAEVVPISLISDVNHHEATKANFEAVLDVLAGSKTNLKGIPNTEILRKVTQEDLVIISWSGHGLSTKDGLFYLLPQNVKNDPDTYGKPFLDSCISSDELTAWLRDIQAGDMALIVDACHSAAAVQSEDFKPGPLGNRGLGQLAYDKGMRVLAATQAENVAIESDRLGNGLLTYALVHDGLAPGKFPDLKSWLAGAVDRVPELYKELEKGTLKAAKGARSIEATEMKSKDRDYLQRPALFDYTRRPSPVPFVGRG